MNNNRIKWMIVITLFIMGSFNVLASSDAAFNNWRLLSPERVSFKQNATQTITLGLQEGSTQGKEEQTIEIQGAYFLVDAVTGKTACKAYSMGSSHYKELSTERLIGEEYTSKLCFQINGKEKVILDGLKIYRAPNQTGDIKLIFNHNPWATLTIYVDETIKIGQFNKDLTIQINDNQELFYGVGERANRKIITLSEKHPGTLKKGIIQIGSELTYNYDSWRRLDKVCEGDISIKLWDEAVLGTGKIWIEIVKPSTVASKINLYLKQQILQRPLYAELAFKQYDLWMEGNSISTNKYAARHVLENYFTVSPSQEIRKGLAKNVSYFKEGSEGYIVGKTYYPLSGSIYAKNNCLMAPVKGILESTGIENYTLTYKNGKLFINIENQGNQREIVLQAGKKEASLNQQPYMMNSAPEIKGNSMNIQISEFAKLLSLEVSYLQEINAIEVIVPDETEKDKIKVITESNNLKIGLMAQDAGTMYIKEGTQERLGRGQIKITIEDGDLQGIKMGELPQIKVLKGDIKIEAAEWETREKNTVVFNVISKSTTPSIISIDYSNINISRSVPEGGYAIRLSGDALGQDLLIDGFIRTAPSNTQECIISQ